MKNVFIVNKFRRLNTFKLKRKYSTVKLFKKHNEISKYYNLCYSIEKDDTKGNLIVARRDIKENELILNENPLIYVPNFETREQKVSCYKCAKEIKLITKKGQFTKSKTCKFCETIYCSDLCKNKYNHFLFQFSGQFRGLSEDPGCSSTFLKKNVLYRCSFLPSAPISVHLRHGMSLLRIFTHYINSYLSKNTVYHALFYSCTSYFSYSK